MFRVVIIRHSKAESSFNTSFDFDRNLSEQGQLDAVMMSEQLIEKNIFPDLIFTSPANRTLQTTEIFARKMNYNLSKVIEKDYLYHEKFIRRDFIKTLHKLDDKYKTVFLIGHNPYVSELAARLTNNHYQHIPTSGIKSILLDIESWKDINAGTGKLEFFDFPETRN